MENLFPFAVVHKNKTSEEQIKAWRRIDYDHIIQGWNIVGDNPDKFAGLAVWVRIPFGPYVPAEVMNVEKTLENPDLPEDYVKSLKKFTKDKKQKPMLLRAFFTNQWIIRGEIKAMGAYSKLYSKYCDNILEKVQKGVELANKHIENYGKEKHEQLEEEAFPDPPFITICEYEKMQRKHNIPNPDSNSATSDVPAQPICESSATKNEGESMVINDVTGLETEQQDDAESDTKQDIVPENKPMEIVNEEAKTPSVNEIQLKQDGDLSETVVDALEGPKKMSVDVIDDSEDITLPIEDNDEQMEDTIKQRFRVKRKAIEDEIAAFRAENEVVSEDAELIMLEQEIDNIHHKLESSQTEKERLNGLTQFYKKKCTEENINTTKMIDEFLATASSSARFHKPQQPDNSKQYQNPVFILGEIGNHPILTTLLRSEKFLEGQPEVHIADFDQLDESVKEKLVFCGDKNIILDDFEYNHSIIICNHSNEKAAFEELDILIKKSKSQSWSRKTIVELTLMQFEAYDRYEKLAKEHFETLFVSHVTDYSPLKYANKIPFAIISGCQDVAVKESFIKFLLYSGNIESNKVGKGAGFGMWISMILRAQEMAQICTMAETNAIAERHKISSKLVLAVFLASGQHFIPLRLLQCAFRPEKIKGESVHSFAESLRSICIGEMQKGNVVGSQIAALKDLEVMCDKMGLKGILSPAVFEAFCKR